MATKDIKKQYSQLINKLKSLCVEENDKKFIDDILGNDTWQIKSNVSNMRINISNFKFNSTNDKSKALNYFNEIVKLSKILMIVAVKKELILSSIDSSIDCLNLLVHKDQMPIDYLKGSINVKKYNEIIFKSFLVNIENLYESLDLNISYVELSNEFENSLDGPILQQDAKSIIKSVLKIAKRFPFFVWNVRINFLKHPDYWTNKLVLFDDDEYKIEYKNYRLCLILETLCRLIYPIKIEKKKKLAGDAHKIQNIMNVISKVKKEVLRMKNQWSGYGGAQINDFDLAFEPFFGLFPRYNKKNIEDKDPFYSWQLIIDFLNYIKLKVNECENLFVCKNDEIEINENSNFYKKKDDLWIDFLKTREFGDN